MKKTNKLLILLMIGLFTKGAYAQVKVGDNPTTINNSAILEIESTTKGVLIPRMNNTQRNAISSPANGLLIWNSSNNSLEVYKSSCLCWVSVVDGGNTPTNNVPNTPPTASSLNYTGKPIVGQTFTLNYTYADAQNDLEGTTTFQWQVSNNSSGLNSTNIIGATSANYTPVLGNLGMFIRCVVTPRANSGLLNGLSSFGAWTQVEASNIPTVNSLTISGTPAQNNTLTASYTFAGGSGVENTNPTTGTTFIWQTATTNTGVGITNAPTYGNANYSNTFIPQSDLLGRFVRVGVRAMDNAALQATNFVFSAWVGPIIASTEQAPIVSNVSITPAPSVNLTLSGSYSYSDINDDPEGTSTYQWYRADNATGLNQTSISGATSNTYTVVTSDANRYIGFGVTPVARTGTPTGTQVIYYHPNSTLPAATFTFTSNPIRQLPFFAVNRAMNAQNSIEVEIDVSSVGGIVFSSTSVNGYSFSANFTTNTTGIQWVTLTATGTQSSFNNAGDAFTLTGLGSSSQTKSFTIYNSITGAGLTAFSNGGSLNETFNNNTTCQNSIISAGYTTGTCSGQITTSARTYDLVHINGQCWMLQNSVELPTAPCASSINTGCNTWLSSSPGDIGSWGYYNTTTTNGTSGWATVAPAANEGLLYNWSAAMNGSSIERAQGVCPRGWHIPSDCEWKYLEHGQGLSITNQNLDGYRTTTAEGNKLRSVGTGANNSSGFTGLLVGTRNSNGTFSDRNNVSHFWISTEFSASAAHRRSLFSSSAGVGRFPNNAKGQGFSVRCLKD